MKLSELPKRDLIDDFGQVLPREEVKPDNWRLLPWPNLRDILLAIAVAHVVSSWVLRLLGW